MADVVDAATRSRMMAGIRGGHTKPELVVRRGLHAEGLRYRLHDRALPGRPDIVLPRHRAAVFVHGCFWHRHASCRFASSPATRPDFWRDKFAANVARDEKAAMLLAEADWRVAVVWECALRRAPGETVRALAEWVRNGGPGPVEFGEPEQGVRRDSNPI